MEEVKKIKEILKESLTKGIPIQPLPNIPLYDNSIPHAPKRPYIFNEKEFKLSIQNALRYFPTDLHEILAIDFANVIFL
jgi:urocanate hydratase